MYRNTNRLKGFLPKFPAAVLVLLFAAFPLFAQRKVTIKLASLVPENTPWGAAINRMADSWAAATNGEVELVVYHNGVAGEEDEVLRKLRMNQIQAAIVTSSGLSSVSPDVMTLSYPLLIHNDDELEAVLSKLKPELEAKMTQGGFVTLAWARAGWVKIFSRSAVFTPGELRRQKLGTTPDDLKMIQAFKTMGFQMVPINLNDVLVSLNGGMIDAIFQSPIYVAGSQAFGVAKNMSTVNLAPFMGGILMNQIAWRRIPEKYRDKLLAICKQIEGEIDTSIAKLEGEAVSTMIRYGLVVNEVNPQQLQEWYNDINRHENELAGPVFNKDFYNKIRAILADYRKGK
ncbi:MAG: TRAP transporter substrate-binding protein DctP [Treponema sp.]|jgi:TRAP-type C4-dicarboxylate transport system substrate-binding protein|nr:TRAP transporter substrate-binding protein DctP [Treponema sp.]